MTAVDFGWFLFGACSGAIAVMAGVVYALINDDTEREP
jgi:hypothetical protein